MLRFSRLAVSFFALLCAISQARTSRFTSPLPTGVRRDAVGEAVGSDGYHVVCALAEFDPSIADSDFLTREPDRSCLALRETRRRACTLQREYPIPMLQSQSENRRLWVVLKLHRCFF